MIADSIVPTIAGRNSGGRAWFYWHVVMMGVPLEKHTRITFSFLTKKYYLGYILFADHYGGAGSCFIGF